MLVVLVVVVEFPQFPSSLFDDEDDDDNDDDPGRRQAPELGAILHDPARRVGYVVARMRRCWQGGP
ncbi:MAG: hypothetical protein FJ290_08965 [Planctomycetes bacterium]|nr:hypothetical protein [Planctomycetota bacterium]